MKYSIIICYRDRETHLNILAPRLREVFGDEAEIIVVEQDDQDKFLRGQLFNTGVKYSKGDILIFHDVDHYPVDDSIDTYEPPQNIDVLLPLKYVTFVDNETLTELPPILVPSGYRHFKNGVDEDFFGGVEIFRRDAFFNINGFNAIYRGWGLEDADLRERINHFGLKVERGTGKFYALQHKDSFPGIEDEDFQFNQQLFENWEDHLGAGIWTQVETVNEIEPPLQKDNIDRWLKVSNFFSVSPEYVPYTTLGSVENYYKDESKIHVDIWLNFKALVNAIPYLKQHRDWVIANNHGYGNRSLHWMWYLLMKSMPQNYKMLEIGVFKGQVVSLMSLLNKLHNKNGEIFGVTPLDSTDNHPEADYEMCIRQIYGAFGLDGHDLNIIQGLSTDENVIEVTREQGPFDIMYIDGGHSYEVVLNDLTYYSPMVKVGGYLVMDDASCELNIPDGLIRMNWRGIEDVCRALQDWLKTDNNFEHVFAVGHNRIYRRI